MNEHDLLTSFGSALVSQVRDKAIHIDELIAVGKMGGARI